MRLFVVEFLGAGGMAHYAYQLCTALAAREGVDVTLVTARAYELDHLPHNFVVEKRLRLWALFDPVSMQPAPRGPLARSWRKVYRAARRGLRALQFVREWARLADYLVAQRPDIVQFGKINFPFENLFLAHLKRRGLILADICHEFEVRERSGSLLAMLGHGLYAGVFDHFDAIFLHGESNRERFQSLFRIPAGRAHAIPLGNQAFLLSAAKQGASPADLRRRYGLSDDESVVLFFGILAPSKGVSDLLRAFAQVRKRCRTRLLVAGFPSKFIDMDDLRREAAALDIADAVIFDTRYIPFEEVGALMQLSSVVVYPYRNSTQSSALQVAYTFGRPVVATRVGGLPEAVDDGRSGLLVPPEAPEALAEAIVSIIEHPDRAAEMGAYARHLSETRYAWAPIARRIEDEYRRLLGSPG